MQRVSTKSRLLSVFLASTLALLWCSMSLAQQSVEENIRSVSKVCLAGQSCVGATHGGSVAAPAAAAPQAPAAPVVATPVVATPAAVETAPAVAAFDAAATYQMSCFACHGTGAAGAPKIGDKDAWTARLEKGMDAVMVNATNGLNAMPPKGMCMTCSDENLRALVEYMVSQSQ